MALIATSVEQPGIARLFFDLTSSASDADQDRIAAAIEHAFALTAPPDGNIPQERSEV